jgi:flagellin
MTSINTNIGAQVAQKNMLDNTKQLDEAMARLSSGKRINSAADDAAGSAIASKMEAQVRSMGVAIRNSNDAISLTQTAEGALGEVETMLQRMRELAVQAGNDTLNASDRTQVQAEMDQLSAEINSISANTNYNGNKLLDGSVQSMNFQIGVNATDTLGVALQNSSVSALGVGSSVIGSAITSERMVAITASIAAADIKINGENFSAALLDVDSTSSFNGDGRVDATGFGDTDNSANGGKVANTIAQVINTNSHVHGATATAFNKVVGNGTFALTGTLVVNDVTLNVDSSTSRADFVKTVNENVAGVVASLDGVKIVFSNDDGDEIKISSGGAEIGMTDNTYGGYVSISNNDGSDVKIESGSVENGYGASAAGERTDLGLIGFNKMTGTTLTSSVVTTTELATSHNVKINGVAIGDSASDSAGDKATAINAADAGVTASAKTVVRISVDLVTPSDGTDMSDTADASINGITTNLSSVTDIDGLVTTINTALDGKVDIVATTDTDGMLVLTSNSGLNITVAGGTETAIFDAAQAADGTAFTVSNSDFVAFGVLTLSSDDGSSIVLEDGEIGSAHVGLDTLGLQSQSQNASTTIEGLSVSSVATSQAALSALDTAIDKVSSFRASFGAYENRLDAVINNLTTLQVNTDAARSRIEDADFAKETTKMTKAQILSQAATSMLAQANASKQSLLALLQG